jgi:ABC-type Fe3+-hydroxamate transport system substrate-binding protein
MRKWAVLSVLLLAILGCGDEFATTAMQTVTDANGYALTLVSSPDNINIHGGGTVTVLIEVTGPDGAGVQAAAVVLSCTLGTLGSAALTTDVDGYASTTLTPGTAPGYAILVGTYKGAQAMVKVDFWSGPT